jgi:hypothetical protein
VEPLRLERPARTRQDVDRLIEAKLAAGVAWDDIYTVIEAL